MRLESWMKAAGHDDQSFAAEIVKRLPAGEVCSASGVRKWRLGYRMQRPPRMKIIRQITDGKVTPNDFADLASSSDIQTEESGKAA